MSGESRARETSAQRRARRKAAAPLFFGKQMLLFGALVFAVLVLDFAFYLGIAIFENDAALTGGAPNHLAREAGQSLEATDEGWSMPDDVQKSLDEAGCWCILIDYGGEVVWQTGDVPQSALRTYNLGDTAVFTRYGYLEDYPSFIWQRDDGLLVTCYPKGSYYPFATLYIPDGLVGRIPFYLLAMVVMDAAVFFAAYVIFKRRVLKGIEPLVESLDNLAHGRRVHMDARGALSAVGESVNAASAVMQRKDEARKRWVSGVSHDIRTPLAISMGNAERIAGNADAADEVRDAARAIVAADARIRDLVGDLNIASKLEYDMQPLDARPCLAAALTRSVAAEYLNDGLDERFDVEVDVEEAAEGARADIDERLMRRALRNLADNAMRHNEGGCRIAFTLHADEGTLRLGVSDDGEGMDAAALSRINREADEIANPAASLDGAVCGPTPPPGYERWRSQISGEACGAAPGSAPEDASEKAGARGGDGGEKRSGDSACGLRASDVPETPKAAPTLKRGELAGFNDHGLGLSLVARIAAAHGGRVEFSETRGGGFTAEIILARL